MSYEIELIRIDCNDAQEVTDQPFLYVNGQLRWGPVDMRTGGHKSIGMRIPFDGTCTVTLREDDPYKNDTFGSFSLTPAQIEDMIGGKDDRYLFSHTFAPDRGIVGDARYTLVYNLRKI